ncbi:hypothetical protein EYC84_005554 [Monilinia fructicola]|uniref:Uncharacterized protein n=1 Tax=Monilinia fructicola TaxID=38448 RepID=A0A5M9JWW8_MONFR|nr:hypothetical protein EYC84_005554 [Monilinia fructicola]
MKHKLHDSLSQVLVGTEYNTPFGNYNVANGCYTMECHTTKKGGCEGFEAPSKLHRAEDPDNSSVQYERKFLFLITESRARHSHLVIIINHHHPPSSQTGHPFTLSTHPTLQ